MICVGPGWNRHHAVRPRRQDSVRRCAPCLHACPPPALPAASWRDPLLTSRERERARERERESEREREGEREEERRARRRRHHLASIADVDTPLPLPLPALSAAAATLFRPSHETAPHAALGREYSLSKPNNDGHVPATLVRALHRYARAHHGIEAFAEDKGVNMVTLRPNWFFSNLLFAAQARQTLAA